MPKSSAVPRFWSIAVALFAFLAYLALCPPVSGDKDSAEFTIVLAKLGVAHPTGYPLFTLLGHCWVVLVHGLGMTWAWAANSWTALGGGVAMYFLQRLALALIAGERLSRRARFGLSVLPVGLFALNPIWTYETTLAEVYAWHVAWALGAALLFLNALDSPGLRTAVAWGFVCGIGAAHHATSVFVVLPLTAALVVELAREKKFSPSFAVAGVAAGLVPLTSYALLLVRPGHAPAWPMLRPGLSGLLEHVTGRQYVGLLGGFAPSPPQMNFLLWYVWPFLVPGLLFLGLHARRSRDAGAYALAVSALFGTLYAFLYRVPDPSSYFLYPTAFGLAALAPVLERGPRAVAWAAGALACLLSVAWFGMGSVRAVNMLQFDDLVVRMWRSIPYDKGFVFWNDDMHYKLEERQWLYGEKPDLVVLNAEVLRNPVPRAKFAARFGFDPVPAATYQPTQDLGVEDQVNTHTALPVIDFDPMTKSVRLLKKGQDEGL